MVSFAEAHPVLAALQKAHYEWARRFCPWTLTPWLDDEEKDADEWPR